MDNLRSVPSGQAGAESLDDLDRLTDSSTWTLPQLTGQNSFTCTRTRQQNITADLRQFAKDLTFDAPEHTTMYLRQAGLTRNPTFSYL